MLKPFFVSSEIPDAKEVVMPPHGVVARYWNIRVSPDCRCPGILGSDGTRHFRECPMSSETVACSCMDSWKENEAPKHGKHQWFCKLSSETAGQPLPTRTQPEEVEATLLRNALGDMGPFSGEDRQRAEKLLQTLAGCFESDAMDTRLIGPAMTHILIAFHQIRMDAAAKVLKFTIKDAPKPNTFLDELEKNRSRVNVHRGTGSTAQNDVLEALWFLLAVAHQP